MMFINKASRKGWYPVKYYNDNLNWHEKKITIWKNCIILEENLDKALLFEDFAKFISKARSKKQGIEEETKDSSGNEREKEDFSSDDDNSPKMNSRKIKASYTKSTQKIAEKTSSEELIIQKKKPKRSSESSDEEEKMSSSKKRDSEVNDQGLLLP